MSRSVTVQGIDPIKPAMRTLAVISAILLLAAPDLAMAQGRRDRDDAGGRGRESAMDLGERGGGGGGGRGRGQRERVRDRDEDRPPERRRPQEARETRRVPLRDVLPGIQRRTPGRILDSFPEEGPGGRPQYRVRWQSNDGQRIDYIVDAETGAILRRE